MSLAEILMELHRMRIWFINNNIHFFRTWSLPSMKPQMLSEERYSWGSFNFVSQVLKNWVGHSETDFISISGCNYVCKIASSFFYPVFNMVRARTHRKNQILSRSLISFCKCGSKHKKLHMLVVKHLKQIQNE